MRDSFVFYRGFYEALSEVDPDTKAKAVDALCEYALNGVTPECSGAVAMFFKMAKPQIDANNRRYENGKRGGRPRNQTETKGKPNGNQTETKPEPNVNVNVNANANVNENVEKEKRKRFTPPTLEELRSYIREKGFTFDAETFIAYYDSNGWRIGRNPMKDWKAACRTWQQKEKERRKPAVQQVEPRNYDMDELEAAIYRAQSAAV